MIDWQTLRFAQTWPVWLALSTACVLLVLWYWQRRDLQHLTLILCSRRGVGITVCLPPVTG